MSGDGFTAETRGDRNEKLPCAMSSPVLSNMQGKPENIKLRLNILLKQGSYHWMSF